MNKHVFYFCCLALPALWLTACEQGSESDSEHGELVPLSVNELTLTGEVVTRVPEGPVTTDGAAISVFLTTQNGYPPVYNKTYTCASGQWTTADEPIRVDNRAAQVVGVYDPNNVGAFPAGNSSPVSSTKLTAQAYDETKLWYLDTGQKAVTNTNPGVAFKMQPVYTRIKLSIKRDPTGYVGNCNITQVNLKNGTVFYADNALDVSTGTPQGAAAPGGWTYALNTGNIAAGATDTSYDVLVSPQPLTTGLTITLTVDVTDRSITIPADKFGGSLRPGLEYTVELLITAGGTVTFSGVTKTDIGTTPTDPNVEFFPEEV